MRNEELRMQVTQITKINQNKNSQQNNKPSFQAQLLISRRAKNAIIRNLENNGFIRFGKDERISMFGNREPDAVEIITKTQDKFAKRTKDLSGNVTISLKDNGLALSYKKSPNSKSSLCSNTPVLNIDEIGPYSLFDNGNPLSWTCDKILLRVADLIANDLIKKGCKSGYGENNPAIVLHRKLHPVIFTTYK